MVGEIRDDETAKVAIQAALTGHLVLSTLHTNDSPGAVSRLLNMGIEPYLLASCLVGVVAQRLLRTICPKCKTTYFPSESVLDEISWQGPRNRAFHRGAGCPLCHDSGFKGRVAVCEVIEVDSAIRSLILKRPSAGQLRDLLLSGHNWLDLKNAALRYVEKGITCIDEMLRVCFVEEVEQDVSADPLVQDQPLTAATESG